MRRAIVVIAAFALMTAACGTGTTQTTAPARTVAPPSKAAPAGSGAAGLPTVHPEHVDPTLEALLPSAINNIPLAKNSVNGGTELSADSAGQAVLAFLASKGKAPSDLTIASAFDPHGNAGVVFVLFRAPGVDAAALRSAMVLAGLYVPRTSTPPPTVPEPTIHGGKDVLVIPFPGSGTEYLYARGDVLYAIRTADATLAGNILSSLPS
jgi:hypothetical protein